MLVYLLYVMDGLVSLEFLTHHDNWKEYKLQEGLGYPANDNNKLMGLYGRGQTNKGDDGKEDCTVHCANPIGYEKGYLV